MDRSLALGKFVEETLPIPTRNIVKFHRKLAQTHMVPDPHHLQTIYIQLYIFQWDKRICHRSSLLCCCCCYFHSLLLFFSISTLTISTAAFYSLYIRAITRDLKCLYKVHAALAGISPRILLRAKKKNEREGEYGLSRGWRRASLKQHFPS